MSRVTSELRGLLDHEGLVRYQVAAEPDGEITEVAAGPFVSLGALDTDFVTPPDPAAQHYPGPPLGEMSLDDYHIFLYRWIEACVRAEQARCSYCGKTLLDADDLPDAETWDVVLVEAEMVAWLPIHFDCKRWIPKRLKGMSPFSIKPGEAPVFDLSQLSQKEIMRQSHD